MRKRHEPTRENREKVKWLTIAGYTRQHICNVIRPRISLRTLDKYYSEEMTLAKAEVDSRIASSIVQKALKGDSTMMIFYAKTRIGWSEKPQETKSGESFSEAIKAAMSEPDDPLE